MRRLGRVRLDPWQVAFAAVAGLLLAVIFGGIVGLTLNENVTEATEGALRYDVKLEDLGDDLRVAVLDVRHSHRNVAFDGPSAGAVADFERVYAVLLAEIDAVEQLGVRHPQVPSAGEIRAMADAYYADFRPAVDLYDTDREAFTRASRHGLVRLVALDRAAESIDKLGEQRAQAALQQVERAAKPARLVLIAEFVGFGLIGLGLAYAAVRVRRELRRLHAREQALSAASAQVSQAKSDYMADFMTDVSREMRTPLTVLRGNAEVGLQLQRDCGHTPMLEEIVREAAAMARMAEGLLLLARSEGASPPLELELVDVEQMLAELARWVEVLARERGTELQVELTGDGWMRIDRARIEQTVLILVDNAAKDSPTGGRLTLTASTDAQELQIEVSDRGRGMPEADLPQVFERFDRVDTLRGPTTGSADLGLSVARTIVEAHGGRLEVARGAGEGTRLAIHLPRFAPSAAVATVAPNGPATASPTTG